MDKHYHQFPTQTSPVAPQAAPVAMARRFHEAYERLAPTFGYTTRLGTRQFEPESDNGKLMIAVCAEIFAAPQGDGLPQDAKRYRFLRDRFAGVILREVYAFDPDPCGRLQAARYLDYRTDDAIAVLNSATKGTP